MQDTNTSARMRDDADLERRALTLFGQFLEADDDRAAFIQRHAQGDAALARRLNALISAHDLSLLDTAASFARVIEPEMPPPERIGAYRITGRIGRGGMGAVYRGERAAGDFEHVVAIKVIKHGLFSEALVTRFQRERAILATLSHPNIAQLFDGGETTDGAPYIVMELVEGAPLLDYLRQQTPGREARIGIFQAVCSAVAFAHRALVVHRDLTPANILVTRDGAAKLIDFGISRPPATPSANGDPSSAGDSLGGLSMTPAYAAPERKAPGPVTTAADIYSLGRILKEMFEGSDDPELAAITARASAEAPEDRYPSADALSQDVEAWRRGRPVAAMGREPHYILGKFVARNRVAVAAGAVALACLIGGLGFTIAANLRAEAARADAERRFQQTRSMAKSLLFDVYDVVSRIPGSTEARQALAGTGLTYIDALAADKNAPLDVKVEAIRGYVRLGQVMGSGQGSQLGKTTDSNALLAKAKALVDGLSAADRETPQARMARADLLLEQSGVDLYNNNAIAKARKEAQDVQAILAPIARQNADNARLYAVAIQAEGDSWGWDDQPAKAVTEHKRAEAFIAGLPPSLRDDKGVRNARSANLRLMAEAQHTLGHDPEARTAMAQAVAINRGLVAEFPDQPGLLRKLAISQWYSAVLLRSADELVEAQKAIEEAMDVSRRLAARDARDAGAMQLIALVGEVQAQVLADLGRFHESGTVADEIIALHDQLVAKADGAPGALRSKAATLQSLGDVFLTAGNKTRACATWRDTMTIYNTLDRKGALSAFDRNNGRKDVSALLAGKCGG